MRIGIDSGGTFTDFVVLRDDGKLESFKLRSNPASPASVIVEGLNRIAAKRAEVVHGSTVATNALLERKGAKTAFVTTRGFEDLIAIGRQNRPELYNLTPALAKAAASCLRPESSRSLTGARVGPTGAPASSQAVLTALA